MDGDWILQMAQAAELDLRPVDLVQEAVWIYEECAVIERAGSIPQKQYECVFLHPSIVAAAFGNIADYRFRGDHAAGMCFGYLDVFRCSVFKLQER